MKKSIAILGSTGSIGRTTLDIIRKDRKNFKVILLTANNNCDMLENQALEFNARNILIYNDDNYKYLKKKLKNKKINVFSKKTKLDQILRKKVNYTMCGISGLDGLRPTLEVIKCSKTVGIANKESIICGWYLIKKELNKYNTKFIPIDSEHFSIWNLTNDYSNEDIEEIVLTASGGPFLNLPIKKQKKITPKDAIKHPNWNMGKKISIDSSNLMNKVLEIIEAYRMFDFDLNKYKILIHPQSYVHAIVKFKSGLIKMLLHDTDMKIPISNSIYNNKSKFVNSKKIKSDLLNNLNFYQVDKSKFPSIKVLDNISKENSLYDTVISSANEELVNLFLKRKIKYNEILANLLKILNLKEYKKYFVKKPVSLNKIYEVNHSVRLKTKSISV